MGVVLLERVLHDPEVFTPARDDGGADQCVHLPSAPRAASFATPVKEPELSLTELPLHVEQVSVLAKTVRTIRVFSHTSRLSILQSSPQTHDHRGLDGVSPRGRDR